MTLNRIKIPVFRMPIAINFEMWVSSWTRITSVDLVKRRSFRQQKLSLFGQWQGFWHQKMGLRMRFIFATTTGTFGVHQSIRRALHLSIHVKFRASQYPRLKMIRSFLTGSIIFGLIGAIATTGAFVERWKIRRDERVVRRHRLRELSELGILALQNSVAGTGFTTNNITHLSHGFSIGGQQQGDFYHAAIDESDLTEAALGHYRTSPRRSIFERNVIFRFYNG